MQTERILALKPDGVGFDIPATIRRYRERAMAPIAEGGGKENARRALIQQAADHVRAVCADRSRNYQEL
jgi:hypothetical protein